MHGKIHVTLCSTYLLNNRNCNTCFLTICFYRLCFTITFHNYKKSVNVNQMYDAQTDMLCGYPERFNDSLNSAVRTTYQNWLCSSSMHVPRDQPISFVCGSFLNPNFEFWLSNYLLNFKLNMVRFIFILVFETRKDTQKATMVLSSNPF